MILALAADNPAIAALVAERSPILLEAELVDMVATGNETIQLAIARRPFVSRALAAALSEIGSRDACLALLSNSGARLPRFSLERIIERYGDCPNLRLTLFEREDLPLDLRQVLIRRVSNALRDLIVSRDWMPSERAEVVIRNAHAHATLAAASAAPADRIPALVQQLLRAGELTPAFLIRAAGGGQMGLFEAALAALADMPISRTKALICSGRAASLKALLDKAGLPSRTYPAFEAAIEVMRGEGELSGAFGDYRRATQLIDAILARYRNRPDRELDSILGLLRQFATDAKRAAARHYAHQVIAA
ncbi:MAG TPA: DUF2336 domain-containing protein [Propylenella sp.]|nr:DUF2336 domain-containing protein [Propylenella sp.]